MKLTSLLQTNATLYFDGKQIVIPPGCTMDLGDNTSLSVTSALGMMFKIRGTTINASNEHVVLGSIGTHINPQLGWIQYNDNNFDSFNSGFQLGLAILAFAIMIKMVRKLQMAADF